MKVYFATDHAGFILKNALLAFVRDELGYAVEDCGAYEENAEDDYPDFIRKAAQAVSSDPHNSRAIILGGSGQGEAMCANRFPHVRATVYYGAPTKSQIDADGAELDMIASARVHNDSNILSLGARFVSEDDAKEVVQKWLTTDFSGEERHMRRLTKLG
jgi:ribose 5-phosphate isomerase B